MKTSYNNEKIKLTIDIIKANMYGLLMLIPLLLIYGVPYVLIWHNQFSVENIKSFLDGLFLGVLKTIPLIVIVFLLGVVAHELIHGITWAIFAKRGFKSIEFGVMWKMLAPYCHCKEPLKVKHYMAGAITPAFFLGLLPAVYAIITGNLAILLFGMFFTMAAIGDFMIIYLLRNENKNDLVEDHPSEAGCYVYRSPDC